MTWPCRNGQRCAAANRNGTPAGAGADGAYCLDCLDRAAGRVRGLPGMHARLNLLLAVTSQAAPARRPVPASTVLLNLHADALARDIAYGLSLAGEIVADLTGRDDPPRFDLYAQARLVAGDIARLADLEPWPVMLWTRPGTWRRIAWLAGAEIIERLERLAHASAAALGQARARTHRDLPCARCGANTVGRWAGSDWFDCLTCGASWHENDVRRQDRILVELARRRGDL